MSGVRSLFGDKETTTTTHIEAEKLQLGEIAQGLVHMDFGSSSAAYTVDPYYFLGGFKGGKKTAEHSCVFS